MQCPQISAPSPSKIQRRLVSAVWNDFTRVEVDGEHRAICKHCHKSFTGSSKSGTTHLRNHLSRCSAIQRGESSKRRRSTSTVWNDFIRFDDNGQRRASCKHCRKHFSGSSKSGTTHLRNHLLRCSAKENGESYKNMTSSSETCDLKNPTVINGNSVFDEESDKIQGLDPVFIEPLVCGKDWLDNPIRIAPNRNNTSLEPTHTSLVSVGNFLSLESQEKHAPFNANTELMHANHRITPNRDNEYSPELTQNSFVLPGASLNFETQEKHAPHSSNKEYMLANLSSTLCPEPGPIGHSSFVSAGTSSCLELPEKHAPSSANMDIMLTNLCSTSCSESLPTSHTSFFSAGTLSMESQEEHATSSANMKLVIANHSSTSCPVPLPTGYSPFVLAGTSSSLKPQEKHAPSSANTERMLANLSSTSCSEPLPTGHSSFVSAGTSSILEPQEILGTGMSPKIWEVTVEHAQPCVHEERMFSSETEKAGAQNLVISGFEHSGEIVPFDEASLVGSSSHLANVPYTSSSPRTESSNGSKVLASHKFGGFNNTQQSASSPESMNQSFDVDDYLNLSDYDLPTQNDNFALQSDLHRSVDKFRVEDDHGLRRRTTLVSVLKWFSIRVKNITSSRNSKIQEWVMKKRKKGGENKWFDNICKYSVSGCCR